MRISREEHDRRRRILARLEAGQARHDDEARFETLRRRCDVNAREAAARESDTRAAYLAAAEENVARAATPKGRQERALLQAMAASATTLAERRIYDEALARQRGKIVGGVAVDELVRKGRR